MGLISLRRRRKKYREAAHQLEIRLIEKAVRTEAEVKATLAHIGKDTVHGILAPHHISLNIWGLIMAATSQRGFPNMFGTRFMVEVKKMAAAIGGVSGSSTTPKNRSFMVNGVIVI